MVGQSAVVTLRTYGYDARSDGLGSVRARVSYRHPDARHTSCWVTVPTDCKGLLEWLGEAMAHDAREAAMSSPASDWPDLARPETHGPDAAGNP